MSKTIQSSPVMGVFWMVVTGILFVLVTVLVKYLGPRIPAAESAFLRYALGLVLLIPMIKPVMATSFDRSLIKLFTIRGVAHSFGVALWFYAMARIPIADVTAMNYMSPVYVTLGAALFLGEKLALRRFMAVLVAMIGALIILRPGFREIQAGHLAMVFAAIFFACSYLIAKRTSGLVRPAVVVVMLSISVTIGLAPLAAMDWVRPTGHEVFVLFMVACVATLGHYTMTLAFAAAPVTVTQPVTFLQLVWAVSVGVILFGEPIDPWVILGGGVIMTAISFITWREAYLSRKHRTPHVTATKV